MKKTFDIKLVKFYLWVGLGFFFFSLLTTSGTYPGRFLPLVFNNIWACFYLIALNFILFEYTIPFVLKKRKVLIYNVLLGLLFLFVHLMLYSYGSYGWRSLGIRLHVYTPLKTYPSLEK